MSNWPVVQNGIVLGVGKVVSLGNTPNSTSPQAPPGQLDFSKARNSGLLALKAP